MGFSGGAPSSLARWFLFSSSSYSYPCISPQREQQFDLYDQVEEELEAAQSRASNKDVNLFRLDSGRASRSKVGLNYFIVSLGIYGSAAPPPFSCSSRTH